MAKLLLLQCELAVACPLISGLRQTVVTLLTVSGRYVMHAWTLHAFDTTVSTLHRTHLGAVKS